MSNDDVARLSSVDCGNGNWGQGFSYDPYGNITKSVPTGYTGIPFNPGYNSGNNRANGFNYDGVGDLKLDASYAYDVEGRPVTANGVQAIYDAFNRAVELNSGSSHQQILYDAQGAKLAYMSAQTLQKYMLPLANGVQAVFNSSGISYYRHADWLGSSRLALKTDGSVYADQAYAPFGETYAETGTADRSFTGQTQDTTAGSQGVYDFLLRQQSAAHGRWLAPDPAGLAAVDITNPQTWNRYAYVGNNPLNLTDPTGLDPWDGTGGVRGGFLGLDGSDFCDWFCFPFPFPFPIQLGAGGGGGGHGHPSGGGTPTSNPPGGGSSGGGAVTWPGETNGIPNGLNVNFGGPLGAILPSAICGDLGPCDPIWGSTFAAGGTDCIYLGMIAGGLDFTGLDALFKVTNTGIKLDPSLKDAFKVFAEKGVEEGLGAVATNPALQIAIRTQLLSTGGKFSKKFIGKVAGDVSVGLLVLNSGTALYKAGKFYAGCVQ